MIDTSNLENIVSKSTDNNIVLTLKQNEDCFLPYFRQEINLSDEKERTHFIKRIEKIVRVSPEYGMFIAHMKEDVPGMKNCAKFSNITDDNVPIEIHHGPIFTLFDICEIVLIHFLKSNEKKISTFLIAKEVLEDHRNHLIQVVPLSEMVHAAVHPKKPNVRPEFISIDSAFGDLVGFIIKYKNAISYNHITKIRRYLYEYNQRKDKKSDFYTILNESIKSFK
jgi:hypothetical protein